VSVRYAKSINKNCWRKLGTDVGAEKKEKLKMIRVQKLIEYLKTIHRPVLWSAQIGVFALSGVAAFLLRFDLSLPPGYMRHLAYALPIWICVKMVVFHVAQLHRGWWRYFSVGDLVRLVLANVVGSALSCIVILCIAPSGFPRSIYLLELMICFLGTAGIRVIVRMMADATANTWHGAAEKETLIYGAGEAGVTLLREIQRNPKLPYRVRGFLDDWPDKKGMRILGVPVLGGVDRVVERVAKHHIDTILIAIPSATGAQMTRILERCHAARVECKTIPGLSEVIEERGLVGQIREVAVEDLLGRNPVHLEEGQIRNIVLVTGAAGSIGSEICRQIARFNPAGIVGFEIAETPLFEIDREMRQSFSGIPFYPEVGSVQNRARIDEVLRRYSPSIIYHAAAYKHVPMMEAHVFEAIENNVFGTSNVGKAAAEHGVEDFIMISSDKAVRPTNIMGATKRVAELLLLGLQNGGTRYAAVRFGNVLGSNGSVIPTFKKQIAAGGPVTVTHPEMRRYFMTIPEASQLVLQASIMGLSGEIAVLDMGAPVKIVDLARNLILLSGLRPNEDIKIEFTGIRPGEKLYEELNLMEEDTIPTSFEKIKIFTGNGLPSCGMEPYLEELRLICRRRNVLDLVFTLKDLIPDYNPSAQLLRRGVDHPRVMNNRDTLLQKGQDLRADFDRRSGLDRPAPPKLAVLPGAGMDVRGLHISPASEQAFSVGGYSSKSAGD
jgi:FlaA1/EpsC-like NDP-sugar epimerase